MKLDIGTLENWLWEAASAIRGAVEANKYKDYILPLIFLKRLSDVFDDEISRLESEFGSRERALKIVEMDHNIVRFYIPEKARWENIKAQSVRIGEYLTDAVREVAKENPKLEGVINIVDFNASVSGQRIIDDSRLRDLINILSRHRLGLNDVEPDILGRAYEYLLRKFAEGSGQSAGEFYTPKEVGILMAKILDPKEGDEVYDPCCGSGGLLIKCYLRFKEKYQDKKDAIPLKFFGQEINHTTYAMAKMNAFIHDMENTEIALGDSMKNPAFKESDGSLKKFDVITANPMWNQNFSEEVYKNDPYKRFEFGIPPTSSADWGWIQHMYASLKENGKIAVVLDTGSVSRGSGNVGSNKERDIRKKFVDNDLIEAVILLPENLFYNTTAPGVIIVINKNKEYKDQILLINASNLYEKERPKNRLTDEGIRQVYEIYKNWEEREGLSKIVSKEEVARNDYNLSPSRYVAINGEEEILDLNEAMVELLEAEEERREAEEKLRAVLFELGLKY
ncbi:MAG: type I restriction-modification system subunit M [Sulfurihydrogenibium sp.]|nr:type I restriction-modification system subunit M [Sulfurihydrogenibium sp.]